MTRFIATVLLSLCCIVPATAQTFIYHPFFLFGLAEHLSAGLTLTDVDADGDLDVIVANGRHWAEQDYLYLNLGNGKLPEAVPLGNVLRPSYTTVVTHNTVTKAPGVVTIHDYLPPALFSLDNHYLPVLTTALDGPGIRARGAVTGEVTGDDFDDLVVVSRGGPAWLYAGHSGGFNKATEIAVPGRATGVALGDLNKDGLNDLVFAKRDGQPSAVLINRGSGNFTSEDIVKSEADTRAVLIEDMNKDGYADIVFGIIEGENRIYWGNSKGEFTEFTAFGAASSRTYALAAGDINQDGQMDIVEANDGQHNILHLFNGDTVSSEHIGEEKNDTYGIALGDMNGDGRLDVVVANSGSMNAVFINQASEQ